jgi:propanol-preferring alcohol dehydrogenase
MEYPKTMLAMVLEQPREPLVLRELPVPALNSDQYLIKVDVCGVCRTDLHVVDGELPDPKLPLIPGHEIIGRVAAKGSNANGFKIGDRIGVPWLGRVCGICAFCASGRENLCDAPGFTGYTIDGGYAEYVLVDYRHCLPVPGMCRDENAAPLLCAGLIGYRSYRMAGENLERLGIYGFGGAAHIVAQIAVHEGKKVYAFTRPGDADAQQFALRLGAVWAGDSTQTPPEPLDAAIIFAPVGALVPLALQSTIKGGVVVCGGIHMSDIPSFPYRLLWGERVLKSVANLTRRDGEELMQAVKAAQIQTEVEMFPLAEANEALSRLRDGRIHGAAVLRCKQR